MIKIENFEVVGWEHAIRGMRNPMNSWEKSDSYEYFAKGPSLESNGYPLGVDIGYEVGDADHELMLNLAKNGSVHAKYRRMITVYVDITAPLYWWKEFDTYKVGTVANSCSTMHKIHEKEFKLEDFSCEHLLDTYTYIYGGMDSMEKRYNPAEMMRKIIEMLNLFRAKYLQCKDKEYWWQMIQLLPSSYNQKRTVMLNYEVLAGIYKYRRDHKLDEWREFCEWIEKLPYAEIITVESVKLICYNYEVNGHTGEVVVNEFASDDDIKLAIMDNLYNVEYEKMEGNENE